MAETRKACAIERVHDRKVDNGSFLFVVVHRLPWSSGAEKKILDLCVWLSVGPSVYVSGCLSMCLTVYGSGCLCVWLSVGSRTLSVYVAGCLSVCLSCPLKGIESHFDRGRQEGSAEHRRQEGSAEHRRTSADHSIPHQR